MLSIKQFVSAIWIATLIAGAIALPLFAEVTTPADRVAGLKAHLAESQAVLRQYEWIETTNISIDGNEGALSRMRCYYGDNESLKKEPLKLPAEKPAILDFRFNLNNAKKEDLTGQMQQAVHLVRQYIPLNPGGIQAVTEDSKLSFSETNPGKQGRMTIRDFLKRGDRIELDLDLLTNHPLAAKIYSFYESPGDSVTLSVNFGSLYGTATFAREIVLEDREKKLKATVLNTDFNKTGQ